MSEPFIAEIRIFPYTYAPRGWAYCDGTMLQISQNSPLFAIISTVYGGDGRTTMALPNLTGRSPMHAGRGPGLTQRNLGQKTGEPSVTLQESQIPSHNHSVKADASQGAESLATNNYLAQGVMPGGRGATLDANNFNTDVSSTIPMSADSIGNQGGGQPHDNRQLYLTIPFFIALEGIFPSRN